MTSTAPDLDRPSVPNLLREHADLLQCDVQNLSEGEVTVLVGANEKVIRSLQGVGTEAALRLRTLGGLSAEDVYSTVGKQSTSEARRVQRRAELASTLPALTRGFMAGTIPTANVDAVATARHRLRHNPSWQAAFDGRDASITRKAARLNPKRFSGWMRDLVDRLSDDGETDRRSESDKNRFSSWTSKDGRWQARLDLDAIAGEKIQNAIDAEARSLAKQQKLSGEDAHHGEHLNALAATSLIGSATAAKGRASIHLVADVQTVRTGPWEGTIKRTGAGNDIPLSELRRYLCDAWITHTVLGPSGKALAVGRSYRTATDAQRAALRVMYETCAMCDVRFDHCEMHHIVEWEHSGPTDLDNLIPLCSVHHERVHHSGWRIELDRDRNLSVFKPDGQVWTTHPLPSAAPTWARAQHRNRNRRKRHLERT